MGLLKYAPLKSWFLCFFFFPFAIEKWEQYQKKWHFMGFIHSSNNKILLKTIFFVWTLKEKVSNEAYFPYVGKYASCVVHGKYEYTIQRCFSSNHFCSEIDQSPQNVTYVHTKKRSKKQSQINSVSLWGVFDHPSL